MSNTTTYVVTDIETGNEIGRRNKKAHAIELAGNAHGVRVATLNGKVVYEKAPKRTINMSAPYTRETDPSDTINNKRVAYKRARVGFALLDANKTGEGPGTYSIFDLQRGVELDGETVEIRTTREAGRWFADEAPALRASLTVA